MQIKDAEISRAVYNDPDIANPMLPRYLMKRNAP